MEPVDLLTLQILVREGLDELFPEAVWVRAEIASLQARSNGHCYLELCQSDGNGVVAKAKAIIWRNNYLMLSAFFREAAGSELRPGITVLVHARVSYSELYGLSLIVDEIDPSVTVGEAELQKRRTIAKLEAEGMMDRQKELELPLLPRRLAVISASGAAGFGDFRRHLEENEYGFAFEVTLFEAAMQGDTAAASISDALAAVETSPDGPFDAALILRGGGSTLDLACFDDYGLCFAIANSPLPVLTAIGHDRDFHVADMVAYHYVKTPTALADVFIDAFAAEDERITSCSTRLRLAFQAKLSGMDAALEVLRSRIAAADPRKVLERGYTLVTDADGVVRKSAAGLAAGDTLRIYFSDGEIKVKVL